MPDKLAYEICKAALLADHVTWKDFIREVQAVNCRDARCASGCESETENQPTDFPDVQMSVLIPNEENKLKICFPDSAKTTKTTKTAEIAETYRNQTACRISTDSLQNHP